MLMDVTLSHLFIYSIGSLCIHTNLIIYYDYYDLSIQNELNNHLL